MANFGAIPTKSKAAISSIVSASLLECPILSSSSLLSSLSSFSSFSSFSFPRSLIYILFCYYYNIDSDFLGPGCVDCC